MGKTVWRISGGCDRSGSIQVGIQRDDQFKKLEKDERGDEKRSSGKERIDLDTIILAGIERGLSMSDIRRMQIGQIVDYCISYNERQEQAEKQAKKEQKFGKKRKANQNDINAFFG